MGFLSGRRVRPAAVAVVAAVLTVLGGQAPAAMGSAGAAVVAQRPGAPTTNRIVLENRLPGTTGWRIPYSGRTLANDVGKQVKGYLSSTSVKAGQAASLHVTTNPARTFSWGVYRLGWYAGSGGRLMASGSATGVTQPACPRDSTTGLIRCGWSRSVSIPTTTAWTSGVYVVVLTAGTYQNYATFVVRDDRKGAVVAVQPTNTYQAYNNYPDDGATGKSLYDHNSYGPNTVSGDVRAVKVSFDRPYALSGIARLMADEAPFVHYAESRGFDVTYTTDVDVDLTPGQFTGQRAVVLPGHSEYWSASMYAQLEAARDGGVDVSSLGANNVYWQARVEPSSTGAVGRTLVCYRRSTLDPHPTANLQTILHRDLGRPEQRLLGAQYMSPGSLVPGSHPWVVRAPNHWAYRGTGLGSGQSIPGMVGIETDRRTSQYPMPTSTVSSVLAQSPTRDRNGNASVAEGILYEHPSGATVFNAGSLRYTHAIGTGVVRDARAEMMTTNILGRNSDFASSVRTTRLGGADRYATAALISADTFAPGVPAVYLATGENFPDALAASAATKGQSPILLVRRDSVPESTLAEIRRLAPAEIRIVGGTGVVSAAVATTVATQTGVTVRRYGGANRYETARLVVAGNFAPGVPTVYVATGSDFGDALVAGAAGAQVGSPVLLTGSTMLPEVRAEIVRLRPGRIVIVGSTSVVPAAIATQMVAIAPTVRLAGSSRTQTSIAVARDLMAAGGASTVALATAASFPDALAGGPAVAHTGGALLMVGTSLTPEVSEEIVRSDPATVLFLGGEGVVGAGVATATSRLFSVVNGTTRPVVTDPKPPIAPSTTTGNELDDLAEAPQRKATVADELPWLAN